jgi:quercetin dioxygenase-like cupin family protein
LDNRRNGEKLRLQRVRDNNGQIILNIEGSLPPGAEGPPPHIHTELAEIGVVSAGTLGALVGKERTTLPVGSNAVFPAGVVHTWWNAGDSLLEFGGQAIPAGDLDCYLQAIFAVVNANPSRRPSIFYVAHVLWRYRHKHILASPPRIVQRIAFPLVVFVGHLLGKYRGNDWPGSLACCTGAPEV